MNDDFLDLLRALTEANARYLIVGAHALAVHGVVRATGDLDVWIDTSPDNAARVWSALIAFGAPVQAIGLSQDDLETPDRVIQIGLPPRRIDVLTEVGGVVFADAWDARVEHDLAGLPVPFIGRDHLVQSKQAANRTKDRADLEALEQVPPTAQTGA